MAGRSVYNIQSGLPFSKTLAAYLLDETKGAPESLTRYRILLPTRRTCRILRDTFLSLNEGKPMLLPQMMPLGEVDEDELSLLMFGSAQDFLDIPPAITPLKRQLLLAKLICRVPEFQQGFDNALKLARALCQFMDEVIVEGLDLSDLHKIVPEEFAAHWQITLEFLKIISEAWPEILKANNVIEASDRRNILLHALASHWQKTRPNYPIIAAGSTGSIPAAADVLNVVSALPVGKVILPGLDFNMDDDAWGAITEVHPQNSLKSLIESIGVERSAVKNLVEEEPQSSRYKLGSALMLPAESTYQWKGFAHQEDLTSMLNGLEYYSCAAQQEEASVIALVMRQALEQKEDIIALVTPDRNLARRVKGICQRWGIEIDDSAGENLTDTKLGKFILLALEAFKGNFDPASFLSLFKSGLCLFGYEPSKYNALVKQLEHEILRNEDIIYSHEMLCKKIEDDKALSELFNFIGDFYAAASDLFLLAKKENPTPVPDLLKAHITTLENLAKITEASGERRLWTGDTGKAAAQFFTHFLEHAHLMSDVSYDEYIKVIATLMRDVQVRVPYGLHPRLLILGRFEARLTHADTVILGGLNEGVWPPESKHDPWMSRPMRSRFGLPAIEQAVGFAAHDFMQGFCAPHVIMTRSVKVDGAPTIPSRWLDRLDTLMKSAGKSLDDLSVKPYMQWAKALDHADAKPYERPEPRPPVQARPSGVSVTKVDTWLKDPYAIYMYYVLKLRKIRPLKQDNDAALKGAVLHDILDIFVAKYPEQLPPDAVDQFLVTAKEVMAEKVEDQELVHYWWPRLIQIAQWFVENEQEWRQNAKFTLSEAKGSVDIDIAGASFNLHGRADRIDRIGDGYALIDYKSGGQFSKTALKEGKLAQLPLEAIMIADGEFKTENAEQKTIPVGKANYLGYWKISGGRKAGEVTYIDGDLSETVKIVREGLGHLVETFRKPETPFYCIPDSKNAPRFNDYEHVSRLKEWSVLESDSADGGEL